MAQGTFPIVEAPKELRVTPSRAVRATGIDPRLGADTQAGQRLLKAVAAFVARADLIDADNQLSAATRGANRISNEINDLVLEAEDTEEETFRKISDGITARIEALRPKNEKAARAFDKRLSVLIPDNEEFIANARLKRIETNFLAEEQALLNDVKVGGSLADYLIHLQKGKKLNIPGRQTDSEIKPLQQIGRATATQVAIQSAINGDDLLRAESLLLQAQSLTPQQVASLKKAIITGRKVVQDKADEQAKEVLLSKLHGLSADDAFAIIDADKSIPFDKKVDVRQEWSVRESVARADAAAAKEQVQKTEENRLYDGLADGSRSVADVSASNTIDADAKRRLITDEGNFAQRDIDKNWPLVDDDLAVRRLDSQLSSLEAGTIDRTQLDQQINAAAVDDKLTKETRDKFRGLSKKGGRDAIDTAVKLETDKIRNALLARLTDREARFVIRTQAGTLTPQEQREAGNNAFLLQVNKHQLLSIEGEIERTMRLTGKDIISGIEATVISSTIWEKFRQKTLAEKINDFQEYSGRRIPKPGGFPDERWKNASDREKAAIVEAVDRGMSNEEILKVLKQ